jgi:hypothetical protein
MPVQPGSRLGAYEIGAAIGAGGMGEVYRARDTRLGRWVAIKVLPSDLSHDPEFRERFTREARAISQLQHPHICTLYDIGHDGGFEYLVLELLEGETLDTRLAAGPLNLVDGLRLATQIADALDAAHRAGIVHRDLKPGNVMLTSTGAARHGSMQAKLLDFGLAKEAGPGVTAARSTENSRSGAVTVATPLTVRGAIVGTFQYMSPEQIEGGEADARSDIWSFGCVLYEVFTGQRAFQGKTHANLFAAILKDDPPPLSACQPVCPPALDHIVRRCLAKDPDQRWQTASDLRNELQWVAESSVGGGVPERSAMRARATWTVAAVLGLMAALLAVTYFRQPSSATVASVRFTIGPPDGTTWTQFGPRAVVSPDGTRLILLVIRTDGRMIRTLSDRAVGSQLWIRPLESLIARPLAGTDGATGAFWSPDGRSVGFFTGAVLKVVHLDSERVTTVCTCAGNAHSWGSDNHIYFQNAGDLHRVPSGGGEPSRVMGSPNGPLANPVLLPDGRHLVHDIGFTGDGSLRVFLSSLTGDRETLLFEEGSVRDSRLIYAEPGYLLYVRNHALMARPFDLTRLALAGSPMQIADGVGVWGPGSAILSASRTGVLVYGNIREMANTQPTWFSREGKELAKLGPPGPFLWLRLSPDGTQLAAERINPNGEDAVWILDAVRGNGARLTKEIGAWSGIWAPDGRRVAYAAAPKGPPSLHLQELDAAGPGTQIGQVPIAGFPSDWSRDGRSILFTRNASDLWGVASASDAEPTPYLVTPARESQGRLSPDGRFAAYVSDESGRDDVFIAAFPKPRERIQASVLGGSTPRWRGDGRELFYLAPDGGVMAVDVTVTDERVRVSAPKRLFTAPALEGRANGHYDVTADGQRFLLNVATGAGPIAPVTVVLNWAAELVRQH